MPDQTSHSDLVKKYGDKRIPYDELLSSKEWNERRTEILERDGNECTDCGKTSTYNRGSKYFRREPVEQPEEQEVIEKEFETEDGTVTFEFQMANITENLIPVDKPRYLHVHHKYYILDRLPWKYPDDSLVTLCNECHADLHEEKEIPVYKSQPIEAERLHLTPCRRCHGAGILPEYEHVQGGICFKCRGKLFEEFISYEKE